MEIIISSLRRGKLRLKGGQTLTWPRSHNWSGAEPSALPTVPQKAEPYWPGHGPGLPGR